MAARGQRRDLTPEIIATVNEMAQGGYTNKQIAGRLGISRSTLYEWVKKFPDISDALKRGRDVSVDVAEASLLAAATGYRFEEVIKEPLFNPITGEPILDENGEQKIVTTRIIQKVAHPNPTALIFFLKNKKPDEWNDRKSKPPEVIEQTDEDDMI